MDLPLFTSAETSISTLEGTPLFVFLFTYFGIHKKSKFQTKSGLTLIFILNMTVALSNIKLGMFATVCCKHTLAYLPSFD